jgi:tetratricopeptide (TPR) repeat protein
MVLFCSATSKGAINQDGATQLKCYNKLCRDREQEAMTLDERAESIQERVHGHTTVEESGMTYTPEDREGLQAQGRGHLRSRHWQEASAIFTRLIEQDEEDTDALIGLALVLDQSGQYDQMYRLAQQATQLNPASAEALACKARALQKLERLSEATIANDQALLLDTNLALAWFNRSGQQLLQQRFPEALRYAERAIELDPTDPRSWTNKALAFANMNRPFEALAAVDQALQEDPDHLLGLQVKGEILRKYGRLPEIIETMHHALEIAPDDVTALRLIAYALRTRGEFEQLYEATARLVELAPDELFSWDCHMCALRGLARFEEARAAIDRVIELEPTNIRYLMIRADNLLRLERYREAVLAAERALQFDHEYEPARRIHEKAARLMYQQKRKKKF